MTKVSEIPSVIDLFCGAGGLTAGLESAGWKSVAAVDNDYDCIATLQRNKESHLCVPGGSDSYLAATKILRADIREINASDLRPCAASARWRPDLLAGGPPCQPFSSAGRMKGFSDPRGRLFLEFVRLADELRPRFVLFENVSGLVTAKGRNGKPGSLLRLIQRSFEEIGYACRFALLNSADYGAPQRRIRLFMIGARSEPLPLFPTPSHSKDIDVKLIDAAPWVRLREFLACQPEPIAEDVVVPSKARLKELLRLSPGSGLRAGGIVEANRPGGHWGYRQDCFIADLDLPARTIRAASTPDWIKLRDGSLRRLTWRECAALQGFPGQWDFHGTVASKFRQIGNAVQGHVARALGDSLLRAATTRRAAAPVSAPWPPAFHKRVRYTVMEEIVNGAHRAAARQSGEA